jgi:anti-anti-sigma factor
MELESHHEGTTGTVVLHGLFNFASHADIKPIVYPLLEQADLKEICMDMTDVSYLDSSALGLLLVFKEMGGQKGKTISIRNPSPQVLKILKIVKFETLFKITTTI